ncbi:hypothetical protein NEHOM01_0866 [Nematocida homosporus]|uniref:uncharacterized protein n=1 Tax=Nematocida homosporus TaxID=1912981 RepID=UPI0022203208|nr:uncharacterized protein NEHOM01_0866 [Nematocida homosporus]KAI5185507.1 hypothetical protein NEHOM01_0866 [Nematocida homosporus]
MPEKELYPEDDWILFTGKTPQTFLKLFMEASTGESVVIPKSTQEYMISRVKTYYPRSSSFIPPYVLLLILTECRQLCFTELALATDKHLYLRGAGSQIKTPAKHFAHGWLTLAITDPLRSYEGELRRISKGLSLHLKQDIYTRTYPWNTVFGYTFTSHTTRV